MLQFVKFALVDGDTVLIRVDCISAISAADNFAVDVCEVHLTDGTHFKVVGDMEFFTETMASFLGAEWSAIKEREPADE